MKDVIIMGNSVENTIADVQFSGQNFQFSEDNADTETARLRFALAREGGTVVFGKFKQCEERNCKKTPVEWIVLKRYGNRFLLLSKYVLIGKCFNSLKSAADMCFECAQADCTEDDPNLPVPCKKLFRKEDDINSPYYDPEAASWGESSIRKWLHVEFMSGKFFDSAFSAGEKQLIEKVTLTNHGNRMHNIDGCEPTEDFVFLLSDTEVKQYITSKSHRVAVATPYARKVGASCNSNLQCSWWTRTPGTNAHGTLVVDVCGNVENSLSNNFSFVGVRPAIWVNLDF